MLRIPERTLAIEQWLDFCELFTPVRTLWEQTSLDVLMAMDWRDLAAFQQGMMHVDTIQALGYNPSSLQLFSIATALQIPICGNSNPYQVAFRWLDTHQVFLVANKTRELLKDIDWNGISAEILDYMPFDSFFVQFAKPDIDQIDSCIISYDGFCTFRTKPNMLMLMLFYKTKRPGMGSIYQPDGYMIPLKNGMFEVTFNDFMNANTDFQKHSQIADERLGVSKPEECYNWGLDEGRQAYSRVCEAMKILLYATASNVTIQAAPITESTHSKQRRRKIVAEYAGEETVPTVLRIGPTWTEEPKPSTRSGSQGGTHRSPIPHIRRAHMHAYWTGPRDGERKLVHKFIPQIYVNMRNKTDLETITIRK